MPVYLSDMVIERLSKWLLVRWIHTAVLDMMRHLVSAV